MEPYIILDGVSKSFRSVEVLKPLSIEFEEGLIHGIVGRNGSGKTVMMKLILGFLKPTQGTVTVGKKRVGKDVDFPQDVGAIIENVDFIPYLNAYDNLYNLAQEQRIFMNLLRHRCILRRIIMLLILQWCMTMAYITVSQRMRRQRILKLIQHQI